MQLHEDDRHAFERFEREWRWTLVELLHWPENEFANFVELHREKASLDDRWQGHNWYLHGAALRHMRSEILPPHLRGVYTGGSLIHASVLIAEVIDGISLRAPRKREMLDLDEARRRYWKLIRRLERAPLLCGRSKAGDMIGETSRPP